jgi:hypothetical protein
MMAKISRTFSIDHKIYEKFEDICKSKNINKSKVIQDSIKNFIGENYDIDFNTDYKLKFGDNTEIVKITKKESEFVLLSNGNKMNIFDFEMLYEEEDQGVKQVLKDLQSEKVVDVDETIDPSEMFDKSVFGNPETVKKMFDNIDVKRFLEKTVDDEKNGKERVIIRDLTKEDDNPIIKDDRTFEDKKAEILEKWRSEERERRKIKETFDVSIKPNDLNPTLIKTTPNFTDLEPLETSEKFLKKLEENDIINKVKNKIEELNTEEYKETCLEIIGKTFNSSIQIESHIKNTIQYIINKIILENKNNIFRQDDYYDVIVSYTASSTIIKIPIEFISATNDIKKLISENYKINKQNIIIKPLNLEPLETRGEMISIDRKTKKDIIKRKAQMKKEIQNFHTLEPNNIKSTLEYIFNTNVDLIQVDLVSQNTGNTRKFFKIGINKKYHGITELKSMLSNLGENNYDLIHIDEKSMQDKLKERIDKLNNEAYIVSCNIVSNKPKHILDTLTDLLKGLINIDDMIGVDFDNPIYTIRIPHIIIENGEYLFYFISRCYNIEIDKLIMQPSEVVLEK